MKSDDAQTLIRDLEDLGIVLSKRGDKLQWSAPKGAVTAAHVAKMKSLKPVLMDLVAENASDSHRAPVGGFGDSGVGSCSLSQERLVFLEGLGGLGAAYHMGSLLRLRGQLSQAALEAAMRDVVARQSSLRSHFRQGAKGLELVVAAPDAAVVLARHDLSGIAAMEEREAALADHARDFVTAPFDLFAGPLFRLSLVRLAPEDHALVLAMHHTIFDGWSIHVLTGEFGRSYAARLQGQPAALPALKIQYPDVTRWQRTQVEAGMHDVGLAYWTGMLQGHPAQTALPTDRARPALPSYRGGSVPLELSAALVQRLEALARQEGASLFAALTAAVQVVQMRWSGQEDVVIGTPVACRQALGMEHLTGFFANTVALRGDLSGGPSFRVMLRQAGERVLGALAHQAVPFDLVVDALAPERTLAHHPVFQVMLSLLNTPQTELVLPGLALEQTAVDTGCVPFDLHFAFDPQDDGALRGCLQYASDLFDSASVARMAGHLLRLLEAALAAPDQPVRALDMLSVGERRQILDQWSGRGQPLPPLPEGHAGGLHHAVLARALRDPEAVALWSGGCPVRCGALVREALGLANQLTAAGAGPGEIVGLCVARDARLPVALLAILMTGAAYLPIDPVYPEARQRYMLADAGARFLVAGAGLSEAASDAASGGAPGAVTVIRLDAQLSLAVLETAQPEDAAAVTEAIGAARQMEPGTLAYVLFTSGSTGLPKAVEVTHGNALALMAWALDAYPPEDLACVLASSSVFFDLSVFEIFAPLVGTGSVVVAVHALEVPVLADRDRLSLINTVPSAMAALVAQDAIPPSVRVINLAGEPLKRELVRAIGKHCPAVRIFNLYGPSEDTTYSTWAAIRAKDRSAPTIGRPLAGKFVYLLDPGGQPVPQGVVGELWTGGAGVTQGYRNRPELTAKRYRPDPFTPGPEAGRIYRTGDLAFWNADGSISCLGRVDYQVKIRGYRIELGEIEAALTAQPEVAEAAILPDEDFQGLTAFVAAALDGTPDWARPLIAALQARLPSYMVPARWIALDRLPLTPNGKIDRAALARLRSDHAEAPRPDRSEGSAIPRSTLEAALLDLAREMLECPALHPEDNLFENGLNSIRAMRLAATFEIRHARKIDLKLLFRAPSIRQLAAGLKSSSLPKSPDVSEHTPILSHAQQQLLMAERLALEENPEVSPYNIAVELDLGPAQIDVDMLNQALARVAARHDSLRSRVAVDTGGLPQLIVDPAYDRPVGRQTLVGTEAMRRSAISALAHRPIPLNTAPPWHVYVLDCGPEGTVLLFVFHHLIFDGWSMEIFLDDLRRAYAGEPLSQDRGMTPSAAAHLQNAAVADGADGLDFWRESLEKAAGSTILPGTRRGHDIARTALRDTATLAEASALRALAHQAGTTYFVAVTALFHRFLRLWTESGPTVSWVPVSMRRDPRLAGTIGFFVNVCPIVMDRPETATVEEDIAAFRALMAKVQGYADIPIQAAMQAVTVQPNGQDKVLFIYTARSREQIAWGAQSATVRAIDLPTPRAGLCVLVTETETGLDVTFEYDSERFASSEVQRMLDGFCAMLRAPTTADGLPTADLPVLRQLSELDLSFPSRPVLPRAILDVCASRAAHVALVDGQTRWTYRDLHVRIASIAAILRDAGVKPGAVVGVSLEREADLVASFVAILAVGAVYMPLPTHLPAGRLREQIEISGAGIVLSRPDVGSLPDGIKRVALEPGQPGKGAEPLPLTVTATAQARAYIIFTSGSTGCPKGIAVDHAALVNMAFGTRDRFGFNEGTVSTCLVSIGFDPSLLQMSVPLVSGSTLVLFDDRERLDPALFWSKCLREGVSFVDGTSSHLLPLLTSAPDGHAIDTVVLGGEMLSADTARAVMRAVPGVSIHNIYGPSETTVSATCYTLPTDAIPSPVPVGVPMPGYGVQILDPVTLLPRPIGVEGEIVIRGAGLAQGYIGQTQQGGFLSCDDGDRLYRTGDLGRVTPEGAIICLGRTDNQVKIRGQRIDLAEVEARLCAHFGTKRAVVATHDRSGLLIGYVLRAEALTMQEAAAGRAALALTLPLYAVPDALMAVSELPLTVNGKVDPARLPEPEIGAAQTVEPPVGRTESVIVDELHRVLPDAAVDRNSRFLDIGGHSLLAIQVAGALGVALDRRVPVSLLLRGLSVRDMAAELKIDQSADRVSLCRMHSGVAQVPVLVLVPPALGLPDLYGPLIGDVLNALPPDQQPEVLGIALASTERARSLAELAAQIAGLLRDTLDERPLLLAGWSFGGVLAHEIAGQMICGGGPDVAQRLGLVLIDARLPVSAAPPPTEMRRLLALQVGTEAAGTQTLFDEFAARTQMLHAHQPGASVARAQVILCEDTTGYLEHGLPLSGPEIHRLKTSHHAALEPPSRSEVAAVCRKALSALGGGARAQNAEPESF